MKTAAETILAVPMEVYERSNEVYNLIPHDCGVRVTDGWLFLLDSICRAPSERSYEQYLLQFSDR